MKQKIRSITAFMLACMLLFSSCAMQASDAAMKGEQQRFDDYLEELFQEDVVSNTIDMHYTLAHPENFGIDDYSVSLWSFSQEDEEESFASSKQAVQELEKFRYDWLTEEQRLTYDIMLTYMKDNEKFEGFRLYSSYMSPLNGLQSYLPTILAEYAFYDAQDIEDYLAILRLFPSFFEELMAFEKEQSEAGFFMPDFQVEAVVEQCQELITDTDNHFMLDTFNERIDKSDFLNDKDKERYKAENKTVFQNTVVPAYQYLIDELPKLKGTCKNEGGLANFEKGKEYYSFLVRQATGSKKSVEELKSIMETKMQEDFQEMLALLTENPDAFDTMFDATVDLSDPYQVLEELKANITKDFPTPPDKPFTVHEVPASMESSSSPAYYLLPPIDDLDNNIIYINRSMASENNEDFITLAHEGFPGHLYQTTYFYNTNPNNIRKLLSFSGYVEGWGTYAEMYAYSLAGTSDVVQRLNEINKTYSFAIYCLADIGIHYEGWTYADMQDFCSGLGLDEETTREIYETLVENPAMYLSYYVGYLEFTELRTKAQNALGDQFVLRDFHEFLLKTGPAQFEVIEARMQDWIAGIKAGKAA